MAGPQVSPWCLAHGLRAEATLAGQRLLPNPGSGPRGAWHITSGSSSPCSRLNALGCPVPEKADPSTCDMQSILCGPNSSKDTTGGPRRGKEGLCRETLPAPTPGPPCTPEQASRSAEKQIQQPRTTRQ